MVRGLQRFEHKLEGAVGNAFARLFKGKVHPAEIARELQRDADENKVVIGAGRVLVPNTYLIRLSPTDYDHLHEWEVQLVASLTDMLQEHLVTEGWSTYGGITMSFERQDSLRTGVFEIDSSVDRGAQPAPAAAAAPMPAPSPTPPRDLPPVPGFPPAAAVTPDGATAMWNPDSAPPVPPVRREPTATHYLVVDGPNTRIALSAGNNIIGRGSGSRVKVADSGVSRQHADLVINGHGAVVQDLRSTNGTQVNGRRITSATLRHGDVIRVGHTVLVYRHEILPEQR